jgi:NADH:ubiquinone oxidoreductase subunit 4 (subunit M)
LSIGAIYMLRAVRSILHGPLAESWENVADAPNAWRKAPFALLLGCLLVFGCFPRLLSDNIQASARPIVAHLQAQTARVQDQERVTVAGATGATPGPGYPLPGK